MESRKMVLTNLFAGSGEDADIENRLVDTVGGKERLGRIERDTCIPLFIAALFTIGRTWKQSRCPSTDE